MVDFVFSLVGLVVGFLIGLTGIGGGAIMTPVLILFLGVSPLTAVGSDLAYAFVTKVFGAIIHLKNRTVDLSVSVHLVFGGLPGSVIGVKLLSTMSDYGYPAETYLKQILGGTLVLVSMIILYQSRIQGKENKMEIKSVDEEGVRRGALFSFTDKLHVYTVIVGFIVGLLVGLTSVGSGIFLLVFLLLLHPIHDRLVVGTDIVTATFLVGAAGLAHFSYGNVDISLVVSILFGSIPGVYWGSHAHVKVPIRKIRQILAVIILVSGIMLINSIH